MRAQYTASWALGVRNLPAGRPRKIPGARLTGDATPDQLALIHRLFAWLHQSQPHDWTAAHVETFLRRAQIPAGALHPAASSAAPHIGKAVASSVINQLFNAEKRRR